MATVSGQLKFVTQRPETIDEIWVRAPEVRGHSGGLITRNPDRYKVTGGRVSFEAAPGPAVLVMVSAGDPVDSVKMFIGTGSSQTLADAVKDADLLDDNSVRELDRILREIQASVGRAKEQADISVSHAISAHASAEAAENSEDAARRSATSAEESATSAASSATDAESSAEEAQTAKSQASEFADDASGHAATAGEHKDAAAQSAKDADSALTDTRVLKTQVDTNINAAKGYRDAAKRSSDGAASSLTLAKREVEKAKQVAGGDFVTKEEIRGYRHTVKTEAEVKAVESYAQVGDFIEVLETNRIYEVY
ncbi:hypothetical protein [Corynebacterium minutissimum]|uniref:Phage tail fiber n=1 Tax=Corynebacterium minutissimum TaxID=38301 RepID=A0A376CWD9_9CORY|nr:hypothetical protein [Corynebacterium minutissimum]QRP60599.1 hypothetical protein I6J26_10640 [Corynebacterium minutissimum]STC76477.1 phage tail fiber [Corynebacterium minutissimum]